jgi:hypothetical protein
MPDETSHEPGLNKPAGKPPNKNQIYQQALRAFDYAEKYPERFKHIKTPFDGGVGTLIKGYTRKDNKPSPLKDQP